MSLQLTKARLRQIIKEELAGAEFLQGNADPVVYIISEPSATYEGEGVEIRLFGVYLTRSAAKAALENLHTTSPAAEMFAMPANRTSKYGFTGETK